MRLCNENCRPNLQVQGLCVFNFSKRLNVPLRNKNPVSETSVQPIAKVNLGKKHLGD